MQRSRERNQKFKKRLFLDLFVGKKTVPLAEIDKAYSGEETPGTKAVLRGLKKEFATYAELVKK